MLRLPQLLCFGVILIWIRQPQSYLIRLYTQNYHVSDLMIVWSDLSIYPVMQVQDLIIVLNLLPTLGFLQIQKGSNCIEANLT